MVYSVCYIIILQVKTCTVYSPHDGHIIYFFVLHNNLCLGLKPVFMFVIAIYY